MRKLVDSSDVAYLLYSVLPLTWIWKLARVHGRLTYFLARDERSVVRRNLEGVLESAATDRGADALTRLFFQYRRVRGVLLALTPRLTSSQLEALVPIEGEEHLSAALAEGRGVILLGSHINSVCLFSAVRMLRERGYDIHVAMPESADPWPPSIVRKVLQRRFDTRPVAELIGAFYAQFNIRPIARKLESNAIVTQTGDGLHSVRFVEVEFLGRRVPFPTGMARVAQQLGAVVVSVFAVGAPPNGIRIVMEEPWSVAREEVDQGALERAVAAYAKRLEHHLLENPACWEHWSIENTVETMISWPQRSLRERYEVS